MYQEKGLYRKYARLMKETVDVPILMAGRMDNPEMASACIEDGTCDIISLGRPLLADPDYVNKLRAGRTANIRPCLSCHEGCMGRIQEYSMLNCAVNPQACRERDMAYRPICRSKKVLVVGGGVAGCEAARVLAIRGHQPVLFEATGRLGGNLIPGGAPDFKEDDRALAAWYTEELQQLKVPVTLHHKVTRDEVLAGAYDAVIVATGSTPKVFSLGDDAHVHTAADVLTEKRTVGRDVVIVGAGLVGCETALWLREQGKNVTLVEALGKPLAVNGPLCHANSEMLEALLPFKQIPVVTNAKVSGFRNGQVTVETVEGERTIPADDVILCVGYKEENTLYHQLEFDVADLHMVGDASKVANIMYAIWDAFEVANHI